MKNVLGQIWTSIWDFVPVTNKFRVCLTRGIEELTGEINGTTQTVFWKANFLQGQSFHNELSVDQ